MTPDRPVRRRRALGTLAVSALLACGGSMDPAPPAEECTGYPDQATSEYVLPYPVGEAYAVIVGNCDPVFATHSGIARYAYDFLMPIGTPVAAARGGTVIEVEESFEDGNGVPGAENQLFVLHADGTVARYYHLTQDGALVELGEEVDRGQVIGLSGNTGNSGGPHLHFDVVAEECGEAFFGPRCVTIPLTFRNTDPHPDGLQEGVAYEALPY